MNRRDAIKRTAILMGGTISASAMLGIMSGCQADTSITWTPKFCTTDEAQLLEAIVERIIPRTDTPGAADARVHTLIDTMMAEFYQKKEKVAFRKGLKTVELDAKAAHGKSFVSLTPEQQDELLTKYDEEAFGENKERGEQHFFRTMKELTTFGFFTSEPGATEVLKYDPVPGDYKGCIPFEEVGRTWAT
ncbi:MAG: gluconate 2-dehydrogenase subunit 3 family protein [Saprospiraceae bacterium]